VATTGAASAVPPAWLTTRLAFARNGTELVLGTVWPDAVLSYAEQERWPSRHSLVEGHPHVHGANPGAPADHYLESGGVPPVDTNEDVLLVSALCVPRATEQRTALTPVLTSGRLNDPAPSGIAGYLPEMQLRKIPQYSLILSGLGDKLAITRVFPSQRRKVLS